MEGGMRSGAAIGVLMLAAAVASGCVSSSKYEQAVAEAEEAKNKTEKVQLQKTTLEQEVKSLRDQKNKLTADLDLATSERQRLEDSLGKERGGTNQRVRDLEQRSRDLAVRSRALQQELDSMKKQNESLKGTVARYQKALKEPPASVPMTAPVPPRPPAIPAAPAAPATAVPPAVPAPAVPVPAAPQAGVAPVNINTASTNDMVLFLGITKEEAEKMVASRPYKVKQEIVLKNALPKARFDAIKDRITVAQ
jgi:DNA uptake protein ComE-like DNA-binding protein